VRAQVVSGDARYGWTHEIGAAHVPAGPRPRVSVTWRRAGCQCCAEGLHRPPAAAAK